MTKVFLVRSSCSTYSIVCFRAYKFNNGIKLVKELYPETVLCLPSHPKSKLGNFFAQLN